MYNDPTMLLMLADSVYADRLAAALLNQQLMEPRGTAQPVMRQGSAPMRVWAARLLMILAERLAPRTQETGIA